MVLALKSWGIRREGEDASLADISLELQRGEILTILGPSGCGKTSLLKALCGLLPEAETGVSREVPADLLRRGYLAQEAELLPWLSVAGNIALPMSLSRQESRQLEEIAALLEIHPLLSAQPSRISGGEKQRALLARTLLQRAPVLLLDEPFSKLDPALRTRVSRRLRARIKASAQSALVISHTPEDALVMSDRVLVLGGRPTSVQGEVRCESHEGRPTSEVVHALGELVFSSALSRAA